MMNDRFLVKAKWLKTGEWVEGYYCRISETTYCTIGDGACLAAVRSS